MTPKAIQVKPLENYHISVLFDSGEEGIFDVRPYISGDWFGELADPDVFRTVHLEGISVAWEGGQDISPDCLYANAVRRCVSAAS